MPVYKVILLVEAEDKEDALKKLGPTVLKYLEHIFLNKEQPKQGGWGTSFKNQLFGQKKK